MLTLTFNPLVAVVTTLPLVNATAEPSKLRISSAPWVAPSMTPVTLTVIEESPWALAQAALRGEKPAVRIAGDVQLAAEVQWLRFHAAVTAGEEARALALAEEALALDPRASAGWQSLAAHLVFDQASPALEPDPARRRTWFAAGLAVLSRGAAQAARPQELEFFRGLVLVTKAEDDPELDPGGARALRAAAVRAFERAAELGDARAAELLPQARAAAARE